MRQQGDQLFQRDYQRLRRRQNQTETQDEQEFDGGTWTPTFVGTGTAGTFTYAIQNGTWRRIEDLIFVEAQLAISAISVAPTGNMTIGGLPYAMSASGPPASVSWGLISRFNYTAAALALVGRILNSESVITLAEVFDNVVFVAYPATNFTNAAANLIFNAWYRTDT